MSEVPVFTGTRQQIYDDLWTISVAGLAIKLDVPYAHLMKQIKALDIAFPPSGYWTKLNCGKPVTIVALSGSADEIVSLYRIAPGTHRCRNSNINVENASGSNENTSNIPNNNTTVAVIESITKPEITVSTQAEDISPETYNQYGKTYNVYKRETLYQEVWKQPVTEIAKKYSVSDVSIHKVCKSLNIPTPPAGYWAKLKAGKLVVQIPLPAGNYSAKKDGVRSPAVVSTESSNDVLCFLDEENRKIVLAVSTQISFPDPDAKMKTEIISHRKKVSEWQKQLKENETKGWGKRNMSPAPLLADTVSAEALPRVCHIIDALIRAMEPLGCSLNVSFQFKVNGETVPFTVTEAKDEVRHIPTKEENLQLIKYEEDRRRYSYASKPNIRKYDHPYNGRISLTINGKKTFRDSNSYHVEEKLGEIMIALYEASDVVRKERLAKEEAERKRQEEERLREDRRKRYNLEVKKAKALANAADDYATACKIRYYIDAVKATEKSDEETITWIEWAEKKADWYDPTISRNDECFGERNHEEDADRKEPKESYSSWGW